MDEKQDKQLGVVIIAAGDSSRLGQPKQLIKFKGITLLERAINTAKKISDNMVCVLGFQANELIEQLQIKSSQLVVNRKWQQGMGSSIALGMKYLLNKQKPQSLDAILIMLCDQYLICETDINNLITHWKYTDKNIIASQYFENKQKRFIEGAPAIFCKKYFSALSILKDKGARDILKTNPQDLLSIQIDNAGFDLDTSDDLQHLRNLDLNWEKK